MYRDEDEDVEDEDDEDDGPSKAPPDPPEAEGPAAARSASQEPGSTPAVFWAYCMTYMLVMLLNRVDNLEIFMALMLRALRMHGETLSGFVDTIGIVSQL